MEVDNYKKRMKMKGEREKGEETRSKGVILRGKDEVDKTEQRFMERIR